MIKKLALITFIVVRNICGSEGGVPEDVVAKKFINEFFDKQNKWNPTSIVGPFLNISSEDQETLQKLEFNPEGLSTYKTIVQKIVAKKRIAPLLASVCLPYKVSRDYFLARHDDRELLKYVLNQNCNPGDKILPIHGEVRLSIKQGYRAEAEAGLEKAPYKDLLTQALSFLGEYTFYMPRPVADRTVDVEQDEHGNMIYLLQGENCTSIQPENPGIGFLPHLCQKNDKGEYELKRQSLSACLSNLEGLEISKAASWFKLFMDKKGLQAISIRAGKVDDALQVQTNKSIAIDLEGMTDSYLWWFTDQEDRRIFLTQKKEQEALNVTLRIYKRNESSGKYRTIQLGQFKNQVGAHVFEKENDCLQILFVDQLTGSLIKEELVELTDQHSVIPCDVVSTNNITT